LQLEKRTQCQIFVTHISCSSKPGPGSQNVLAIAISPQIFCALPRPRFYSKQSFTDMERNLARPGASATVPMQQKVIEISLLDQTKL
jgi:hypothetical protein